MPKPVNSHTIKAIFTIESIPTEANDYCNPHETRSEPVKPLKGEGQGDDGDE
jgi:hypothetical protein